MGTRVKKMLPRQWEALNGGSNKSSELGSHLQPSKGMQVEREVETEACSKNWAKKMGLEQKLRIILHTV